MNICKVWDGDYPWDVRVEKVATTLTEAGHRVHMVARNRARKTLREDTPEARVYRLKPWRSLPRRMDAALMFPAFFNPRWVRLIMGTARVSEADLILCRDLPLAPTSIYAARRLGVPVVLDMAENYPAMMRSLWESGCQGRMDWALRNPRVTAAVERWVLRRVDGVLVVVEESKDRLLALGVPDDRVVVVGNTPPRDRADGLREARPVSPDSPLRLVYLGLMEAPRGIAAVIEAVGRSRNAGLPVELSLIGDGREREQFEAQSRRSPETREAVHFHGHIPYTDALKIVGQADIGVVPHIANESWNTTIPNKLFDYMAMGLPVLTSNARPAARVVRETGSGEVFSDVDELLGAIQRLMDVEHRKACGARGYEAIRTRYHWEKDAARMLSMLENVASPKGRA